MIIKLRLERLSLKNHRGFRLEADLLCLLSDIHLLHISLQNLRSDWHGGVDGDLRWNTAGSCLLGSLVGAHFSSTDTGGRLSGIGSLSRGLVGRSRRCQFYVLQLGGYPVQIAGTLMEGRGGFGFEFVGGRLVPHHPRKRPFLQHVRRDWDSRWSFPWETPGANFSEWKLTNFLSGFCPTLASVFGVIFLVHFCVQPG